MTKTNESKVYEVTMKFNKDVLTEEKLDTYLKGEFDEDVFKRDGHNVIALMYVPYDKYTDYEDELSISIGHLLKAGKYGVCTEYFEVDLG